jgi:hypothetical protein
MVRYSPVLVDLILQQNGWDGQMFFIANGMLSGKEF